MTEEQILNLMTSADNAAYAGSMSDLLVHYVGLVAHVSHKINRNELAELIAVGVGLYQLGFREFETEAEMQALLAGLQDRRERK